MRTRHALCFAFVAGAVATLLAGCGPRQASDDASRQTATPAAATPEEARAIAKEAYIYGYPMVDSYRIQYAYFVDRANREFKAPWNKLVSVARVYTPADKAVQTPNSDTPYSFVGMDLRAEPMVLTVPKMEKDRYFSIQLIDLYTHTFDYIGSRATGNDGGNFLIAGPTWQGDTPKGITKVIRAETGFVMAGYRTQLRGPDDLPKVKALQDQYRAAPLSAFLGQPAPKAAPAVDFIEPLSAEAQKASLEVFDILAFLLQFAPVHPSETELRERFARIGIVPGKPFDADALSPEMEAAIHAGIADAWAGYGQLKSRVDAGEVTAGDLFGTREFLDNNYLYRMGGAILGIYGNAREEAMYPVYTVDAKGEKLDGAHRYTLRFAPGQLPPVHAFWSLTMYELPSSLLTENPLDRYLLNSPMLPDFVKDPDGGITFHIQHASPGKAREANWLPAPKGPFWMSMRLYWPKQEALDGRWKQPALTKVQ